MNITSQDILKIIMKVTDNPVLVSIKLDIPLKDQGIDSLDIINIFFKINDSFGININPNDQYKLRTVNDIISHINQLNNI